MNRFTIARYGRSRLWAVWDGAVPVDLFNPPPLPESAPCDRAMQASLDVVRRHRAAGTINDDKGKVSPTVLAELGTEDRELCETRRPDVLVEHAPIVSRISTGYHAPMCPPGWSVGEERLQTSGLVRELAPY